MRVNGQLLVKGMIEALVGGMVCGQGTVFNGAFSLSVSSSSQQAGCGTDGATVTFRVNGAAASGTTTFTSGGSASGVAVTQP